MSAALFSRDILEFLEMLRTHRVRYLVVCGEAVIQYGYARFTAAGDAFENLPAEVVRAECAVILSAMTPVTGTNRYYFADDTTGQFFMLRGGRWDGPRQLRKLDIGKEFPYSSMVRTSLAKRRHP